VLLIICSKLMVKSVEAWRCKVDICSHKVIASASNQLQVTARDTRII
jgi:hypothetical protein